MKETISLSIVLLCFLICHVQRQVNSACTHGELRLVNGSITSQGRLEICINNIWGTVCDDGFTNTDAQVVCRQLGYSDTGAIYLLNIYYGRGTGQIWLDDVRCTGSESTLLQCRYRALGSHDCTHSEDVSVDCFSSQSDGTVILSRNNISSNSYYFGVARVYFNGWGNICDDNEFGLTEANVICHQLGYTGASSFSRAGLTSYGTDYLSTKFDNVICSSSSYLSIAQCAYSTIIDSGCTSDSNDATVYCYTTRIWDSNPFPGMVRLQGGDYSNQGRVEVYCNEHWGTICSDGFDPNDANTICRQLGYDSYYRYNHLSLTSGSFRQPIWNSNMRSLSGDSCFGTRNSCPFRSVPNCNHSSDVTLECRETSFLSKQSSTETTCAGLFDPTNGIIILSRNNISSNSYYFGVIRVYFDGWGNICDDNEYNLTEANVICHQLGYTGASSFSRAGLISYGTDYLSMKLDDVSCRNSGYLSIAQCSYSTYIDNGCTSNDDDANVYCYTTRIWDSNPFPGMVRLQGGAYSNQGRVEVYCNGQWGTICNDGFDSNDANTICRQLGYDMVYKYNHLSVYQYNDSYQPIWITHMSSLYSDTCFGTSNTCPLASVSSCTHASDATVECREDRVLLKQTVTLGTCSDGINPVVNGSVILYRNGAAFSSYHYGIIRIYIDGRWGNICQDSTFGRPEADVICHQLGYTGAFTFSRSGLEQSYGNDFSTTVIDSFHCERNTYLSISQCSYSTVIDTSCTHSYDATLWCHTARIWDYPFPGMVRLQGGVYSNQGRVEVYCNGQWGTICGSEYINASAICRQLGFNYFYRYSRLTIPGNSNQPIWSTSFAASSTDCLINSSDSCPVPSSNICTHSQDLTIACTHNTSYESVNTMTASCNITAAALAFPRGNGVIRLNQHGHSIGSYYYGIIQIYLYSNYEWGNICFDDDFGQNEADVVCHQLGYTGALRYSRADSENYGTDTRQTQISRLSCGRNDYLHILQCSYSTSVAASCNDANDATVYCYEDRIWDSPFSGMIRLFAGTYSNQGRVEVYCNGQWGTICSSGFNETDANTVCRQLGYTGYTAFNSTVNTYGSTRDTQPIWSDNFQSSSDSTCFSSHNSCPSSAVTLCSHSQDVALSCTYSSTSSNNARVGHCRANNLSAVIGGAVGGTLTGIILIVIFISCCCVCCVYCSHYKKQEGSSRLRSTESTERELSTILENVDYQHYTTSQQTSNFTASTTTPSAPPYPTKSSVYQARARPPSYATLPPETVSAGGVTNWENSKTTGESKDTFPESQSTNTADAVLLGSTDSNGLEHNMRPSAAQQLRQEEPPQYSDLYN